MEDPFGRGVRVERSRFARVPCPSCVSCPATKRTKSRRRRRLRATPTAAPCAAGLWGRKLLVRAQEPRQSIISAQVKFPPAGQNRVEPVLAFRVVPTPRGVRPPVAPEWRRIFGGELPEPSLGIAGAREMAAGAVAADGDAADGAPVRECGGTTRGPSRRTATAPSA